MSPTLAHSRSQDPKRGAKREINIRDLLRKADWVAERAPRTLSVFRKGVGPPRYFSRQIDWFGCLDILALRAGDRILGIQSSTFTNLRHKQQQVEASPLLPLLIGGLRDHMDVEVWTWGYRVRDVDADGQPMLKSPGWHYRVHAPAWSLNVLTGESNWSWHRVAACDSRGHPIEGWPLPSVLLPVGTRQPPELPPMEVPA